jgi:hypothetical protein
MLISAQRIALAALACAASSSAIAGTVSGSSGGLTWTAESKIVGVTSTATIAGGGNPIYVAPMPQKSGVVTLIMDYGAQGAFICSGSLLGDRKSVLTAGHCVSGGTEHGGTAGLKSVTAYFYAGDKPGQPGNLYNPDTVVFQSPEATAISSIGVSVHSEYTGQVIDQNDIAVVRLADFAPDWAQSYEIDYSAGLEGRDYTIDGYGGRSDTGGSVGVNLGVGRLREGDNRYDFRLGDADFEGFLTDPGFFGSAAKDFSYIADFDDGTGAHDASCQLAVAGFGLAASAKYCNLGRGPREVSSAGGDSGGPQFGADGRLLSVTSYGLTFGTDFGDIDDLLNDSFGELNGFVPLFIHRAFIESAVPEPQTWAMMLMGFGFVGAGMRVRSRKIAFA